MSTDFSRPLRVGSLATGADARTLRDRVEAAHVHVTADVDVPGCATALGILIGDLRRLPVQLSLDPHGGSQPLTATQVDALQAVALGIDPDRPLMMGPRKAAPVHVHIGANPPPGVLSSAVPEGHGVRLRPSGHAYPALTGTGSGLGAMLTAAALAGEVFKEVTSVAGFARHGIDFCPVTLESTPGEHIPMPDHLPTLALVGAGAIGTAIAVILDALGIEGDLIVVDPQPLDLPNVMTYSLGTRTDAERAIAKVDLLARQLPRFDVTPIGGTAQDLIERVDDRSVAWPHVVLGAVDSIDARRQLQRLYADLTLDGATGGAAGTTLSLREGVPTGPCLNCFFPEGTTFPGPTLEQELHQRTGLPLERIARGDAPLVAKDLDGLTETQRRILEPHLGAPVCGLSRLIGIAPGADDTFRPSAAFVSQQAACLVVGALLGRVSGVVDGQMRDVEYNALAGPRAGMVSYRRPRPGCACQRDQDLVQVLRASRGQ